jgi:Bifunctional DNA primase/polymerase, N-terminal
VLDLIKPSQASSQALAAAVAYGKAGMAIFPVKADKIPLTPHGLKNATTDLPTIIAWWRRFPFADIGWAIPESAIVIDIDRKNGRDGFKDFEGIVTSTVFTDQYLPLRGSRFQ